MERREPVLDPPDRDREPQQWGNLRFRPRRAGPPSGTPEDNAESRFWTGVMIFVMVALIYPWYSHWVDARILAWQFQAASKEIERVLDTSAREMRQQAAVSEARRQADASRHQAASRRQRVAGVRVVGAVPSSSGPIAIVRLGQSDLAEASTTICRQAEAMLGMGLEGQVLRVQQHQGGQSTVGAGTIRC